MKPFFSAFTLFIISILMNQAFGQYQKGLFHEDIDTTKQSRMQFSNYDKNLPSRHSLLQYAPPIGNQKQGSCVAWAIAYTGLTIVKRLEQEISMDETISPMCLHSRLMAKQNVPACSDGSNLTPALNLVTNYGCEKYDSKIVCKSESASTMHENKLYHYDQLETTSLNIKSALHQNYPVVIAVKCFDKGWLDTSNLIQGVWNGKTGKELNEGHAMCIIGYDDSIGGGAFHVQNSWGTEWGVQGYFWLPYKDLNKILVQAFSMRYKNPTKSTNTPVNKSEYFRVYNHFEATCYTAIAKKIKGVWNASGWYAIPAGTYYDHYIGDRESNEFYWIASAEQNKVIWSDTSQFGKSLPYEPKKSFNIQEYNVSKYYIKYNQVDPKSNDKNIVYTLRAKKINTRGMETLFDPQLESRRQDSRPPGDANKYWKKEYFLYDLYTNEIIFPNLKPAQVKTYTIWFWENQSLKVQEFTEEELEKLENYKFKSEQSAQFWKETNS